MICWALFQTFSTSLHLNHSQSRDHHVADVATEPCLFKADKPVGLVKNYESLLALRFCLGIFEAGLFPGLNFFLTGWYRRVRLKDSVERSRR
jgi:MFS family permease